MDHPTAEPVAPEAHQENTPVPVRDDKDIDDPSSTVKSDAPAKAPSAAAPNSSAFLQTLTDKVLHFLSHASNETLGACLAGFGATTYFVLGRVGLLIIGVAGGVVLQATWQGIRGDDRDEATKRADLERQRETAVDVARRVLEWRQNKLAHEQAEDTRVYAAQALDYSKFGPETSAALNTFTDAVIKDYVHYWYDPTIPGEQSFPAACRKTFTAFVLSLSGHLERKRPADTFLDFVGNASSIIIVFLTELAVALNASPNKSPEEAVSTYLELKPDSSLSYMLNEESQKSKLADAAEDILQSYLDPKSYNCPPVHAFLKEVLAQLVLGMTVDMCSKPEWINDWLVYGLEESETTKEVMNIVDAGVEGRPTPETRKTSKIANEEHDATKSGGITIDDASGVRENASSAGHHRHSTSKAELKLEEDLQREVERINEMILEQQKEEQLKRRSTPTVAEDNSDGTTQGAPTPSSSQSSQGPAEEESTISVEGSTFEEPITTPSTQFISFDQLVPASPPTALTESPGRPLPSRPQFAMFTLHNASISIHDDSVPGERTSIKAKPTFDYLIQIEPSDSTCPGWMIVRKYMDFETLHEVLKRIAVITGVPFNEAHAELPKWRVHTKASLREELERYLTDAVRFQPLAESEGMKRFLEKDQGLNKSPNSQKGFGWPAPDALGKISGDMFTALTKAPKQVAGGGKAVFGGVAGLVGAGKKPNMSQTTLTRTSTNASVDAQERLKQRPGDGGSKGINDSYSSSNSAARASQDSLRAMPQTGREERRGSGLSIGSAEASFRPISSHSRPASLITRNTSTGPGEMSPSRSTTSLQLKDASLDETINLPPPPSEMPEDYDSPTSTGRSSIDNFRSVTARQRLSQSITRENPPPTPPRPQMTQPKPESKPKQPLTDREASVAIEIMFAVITQLYTLSGAWQIRRTLLTAAKTFLLRPGNPQLLSIRDLLQESLLESNLSDAGLAHHILKLRYNTLPTEKETEDWKRDYPEKSDEQKDELRIKARRLLVTKGMPQALTSVMGAAASGEALGKVFDCLQVPQVSRGLIFGLMLQALRVVTQ